jgi:hypothetical protein
MVISKKSRVVMRIILAGCIGRFPLAGHAWVTSQYLLGLRALGHDVYYLEDAGEESWVYEWSREEMTSDINYPADFIARILDPIGMEGRWIYRTSHHSAGMSVERLRDICQAADLLLIRGAPLAAWRDEYSAPLRRAFIDVDPLFTQVKATQGDRELIETLERCERLFTIAQRIGKVDCTIPLITRQWHLTVSPVFLPAWQVAKEEAAHPFTTVMQWDSYDCVHYGGIAYGNKSHEFPKFTTVPRRSQADFAIAMIGRPPDHLDVRGWSIVDGTLVSSTPDDYRAFIQQSFAEFSVAKQGYAISRGGWFSDRSVCYLASGRPVVVQDTGLRDWLPVGQGLVCFQTVTEAVEAVADVQQHYSEHRVAARRIAEEYFSTERVLPTLIEQALS